MENFWEENHQEFRRVFVAKDGKDFSLVKKEAEEKGIPAIEKELGIFLSFLVSLLSPQMILEIGSGNGYSALWLEKGLEGKKGSIISVERSLERAQLAQKNISRYGQGKIQIVAGNALDLFRDEKIPHFDFIFIDGRKNEYVSYLKLAEKILKKDGIFLMDNLYFHGYVLSKEYPSRYRFIPKIRQVFSYLKTSEVFSYFLLNDFDGLLLGKKVL